MKDVITVVLVVAVWFVLMRWVLPALGVPTCCGGSCTIERPQSTGTSEVDWGEQAAGRVSAPESEAVQNSPHETANDSR